MKITGSLVEILINLNLLPEHDRPSPPNEPVEHIHSGPLYDVAHISWHPAALHDIGFDTLIRHYCESFILVMCKPLSRRLHPLLVSLCSLKIGCRKLQCNSPCPDYLQFD